MKKTTKENQVVGVLEKACQSELPDGLATIGTPTITVPDYRCDASSKIK